MSHKIELDLFPLGATFKIEPQIPLQDWEIDQVVYTVDRHAPYGNHSKSRLEVVRDQGVFLVTHRTWDGLLIEYQPQHFRTIRDARRYAQAQSRKCTNTGRLWTFEFDGEICTHTEIWDHHIHFGIVEKLMRLAGMDSPNSELYSAKQPCPS